MTSKKNILVLGSTGNIGRQTLEVIALNKHEFKLTGIVSYQNEKLLKNQANLFNLDRNTCVLIKENNEAFKQIKDLIYSKNTDIVVNAISGSAGLEFSYLTLKAHKTLALANKESLVVGGDILMPLSKKESGDGLPKLLPIDSEHGAIFQCLVGENKNEVSKIWITASGGPFRGRTLNSLNNITPKQALAHPTWNMGKKITIDSSTLMNKGLEVIEAHHLFDIPYEKIKVLVQPQSIIHSMVEFIDGSVKAHLGTTNMKIPIQYALSYPKRLSSPVAPINFYDLKNIEFYPPDFENFPCLKLAYEAGKMGGFFPCVMNAANEVAVELFLDSKIKYIDICKLINYALQGFKNGDCIDAKKDDKVDTIEHLKCVDVWSRHFTYDAINLL